MGGHLHDEEREELVLLVHLPRRHWVTVVVVGVHRLHKKSDGDITINRFITTKDSYKKHNIL